MDTKTRTQPTRKASGVRMMSASAPRPFVGQLPHISESGISVRLHIFDDVHQDEQPVKLVLNAGGKSLSRHLRRLFRTPAHPFVREVARMNLSKMLVSVKADGIRSGLFIDSEGICYYIYPKNWNMYRIGHCTEHQYWSMLFDGELMDHDVFGDKCEDFLFLFDLVHWDEGKISPSLQERAGIARRVVRNIVLDKITPLRTIKVKNYFETKDVWRIIYHSRIRKDGLIFSPKYGKPGKECMRWKPNPSITLGLQYVDNSEFRIFFMEKTRKGPRKRFYNMEKMAKVFDRFNASELTKYTGGSSFETIRVLYNRSIVGRPCEKTWADVKEILVEMSFWYDPFLDKNDVDFTRIRFDKKWPENIDLVPELMELLQSPTSLDDIYRRKRSFYKMWQPTNKKAYIWSQYVKRIKEKVYLRWVQPGCLLDVCSGRGSDNILFYRLGPKNGVRSVECLEKDVVQCDIMKSRSITMQHDELAGYDCKLKVTHGDINAANICTAFSTEFDTVTCSHSIQFVMDPYEEQFGLKNISMLTKMNGILILLYMDGDQMIPQIAVNAEKKHEHCDCSRMRYGYSEDEEEPIADPYLGTHYHLVTNSYCDSSNTVEFEEDTVGFLYRHDRGVTKLDKSYAQTTHVWVKLPSAQKAVREPIVRTSALKATMNEHGFSPISIVSYWEINPLTEMEKMAKMFKVAIFRKTKFCRDKPYILHMVQDCFIYMLQWLGPQDICTLGQTHRLFTNLCLEYMKKGKIGWNALNKKMSDNTCYEYFSYS